MPLRPVGYGPDHGRLLSDGYPGLAELALEQYVAIVDARPDDAPRVRRLLRYFGKLIDVGSQKTILVLGCGPKPTPMIALLASGHQVIGVEPVPLFASAAREYLATCGQILQGYAESVPLDSSSVDIVFFESVLEHVNSPLDSLKEIYRVLRPGGLVFILTTNRHRFSPSGWNGEFNIPHFNWLPGVVKESYIFFHQHYDPRIANFTERPAVHWFSYSELCALGRLVGFDRFYSLLDLQEASDESISGGRSRTRALARTLILKAVHSNPLVRAAALTQVGGDIVMLKQRPA